MARDMKQRGALRVVVVLVLGSVLLSGTAGAAEPLSVVGSGDDRGLTLRQQRRSLEYWTPERMREATPVPLPAPRRAAPRLGVGGGPTGRPGSVDGSARGDGLSIDAPAPATYAYPFPFTRYRVQPALDLLFPYRAIGKVFFRQAGFDFVCSGASVAGGRRNVVYTAGHCLSTGAGAFSTDVIFVPAYRKGKAPFGRFAGKSLWTTSAWHTGADFTYDLGAFHVGKNARGQTLRSAVGFLGFAWNQPRTQHWNAFGWPLLSPFNGETLQVCQASHAADDLSVPGAGPDPMGIGCDQTGGASGGPWVLGLRSRNWVNSVNSYKYRDTQPLAVYGPYFDSTANNVRCVAATGDTSATSC